VRIWQLEGVAAPHRLRGHESWGFIDALGFSSDGERLVSASMDKTVRVWRADTGVENFHLDVREAGNSANMSAAFSPDGTRLVLVVHDVVRVCDAANGAEQLCLRGHEGQVESVAFSPDGSRIVTGGNDKTVRVWDAVSGAEHLCLRGHEHNVSGIAYSPDGRHIISASFDCTIRIWSATSGAALGCLRGHEKPVECAIISPDGRRVVSRAVDHTVRVWDAATGAQLLCMSTHEDGARGLAFSSDGQWIISAATRPAVIRIWNAETGATREVLQGTCDVDAMAAGGTRFPWRAIANKLETTFESAATGEVVAWFPGDLRRITTHTSGLTWAGADGSNLYLVTLELGCPAQ
jgi:WD40 repeat protein